MSTHGHLFEPGSPRQLSESLWPGYDPSPMKNLRLGVLTRLFRRRTPRHAA